MASVMGCQSSSGPLGLTGWAVRGSGAAAQAGAQAATSIRPVASAQRATMGPLPVAMRDGDYRRLKATGPSKNGHSCCNAALTAHRVSFRPSPRPRRGRSAVGPVWGGEISPFEHRQQRDFSTRPPAAASLEMTTYAGGWHGHAGTWPPPACPSRASNAASLPEPSARPNGQGRDAARAGDDHATPVTTPPGRRRFLPRGP